MDRYPEAPAIGYRSDRQEQESTAVEELPGGLAFRDLVANPLHLFTIDHEYLEQENAQAIRDHFAAWKLAGKPPFEFVWPNDLDGAGLYSVKYTMKKAPHFPAIDGGIFRSQITLAGHKL